METTIELYPKMEFAAWREWQDAVQSGALEDEVEELYSFWQKVVALTRGAK